MQLAQSQQHLLALRCLHSVANPLHGCIALQGGGCAGACAAVRSRQCAAVLHIAAGCRAAACRGSAAIRAPDPSPVVLGITADSSCDTLGHQVIEALALSKCTVLKFAQLLLHSGDGCCCDDLTAHEAHEMRALFGICIESAPPVKDEAS